MYEWIKATVDCEGELVIRHKLVGFPTEGSLAHDEDVSDWSDSDIRKVIAGLLDAEDQKDIIEVIHE